MYGVKDAQIHKFPVHTGLEYFGLQHFNGQVPTRTQMAEVRLVKPYHKLITTAESAPSCLIQGSRAADIIAPVVYIGVGDDPKNYEGKDLEGKIVLAGNALPDDIRELAVHEHKAAGLLWYLDMPHNSGDNDDAVIDFHWTPFSKSGKKSTFGISLSNNQYRFLKNLIDNNEEVVVKIKIETEYRIRCQWLGCKPEQVTLTAEERALNKLIPVPVPGIMGTSSYFGDYYEKILGKDKLASFKLHPNFAYGVLGYTEAHNFIDGKKNILQIYQATQAELWSEGYPSIHDITLTELKNYMRMLEAAKVITIEKRN